MSRRVPEIRLRWKGDFLFWGPIEVGEVRYWSLRDEDRWIPIACKGMIRGTTSCPRSEAVEIVERQVHSIIAHLLQDGLID